MGVFFACARMSAVSVGPGSTRPVRAAPLTFWDPPDLYEPRNFVPLRCVKSVCWCDASVRGVLFLCGGVTVKPIHSGLVSAWASVRFRALCVALVCVLSTLIRGLLLTPCMTGPVHSTRLVLVTSVLRYRMFRAFGESSRRFVHVCGDRSLPLHTNSPSRRCILL